MPSAGISEVCIQNWRLFPGILPYAAVLPVHMCIARFMRVANICKVTQNIFKNVFLTLKNSYS